MTVEPLPQSAVLTHHWLVRRRGGEKVLEALAELTPAADVYTLVHDPHGYRWRGEAAESARNAPHQRATRPPRIITSWLDRVPGAWRHYPRLLPLMPNAARSLRLPEADMVLCSDAAIAKAMPPRAHSRLICYCHSPMRYVWEPEISRQYRDTLPRLLRPLWGPLCRRIREADRTAAERVDLFIANSQTVVERIRRAYDRESVVIFPPVELPPGTESDAVDASDSEKSVSAVPRESFYLCVGQHVAYKRLPQAVEACVRLGRRLVVIGEGPDVERLRRERPSGVEWLGRQSDAVLHDHYRRAAALLFPGEEDFGIVPVEAMAHGCPVIALGRGGATETVIDGVTGVLYAEPDVDCLIAAMRRAEGLRFDAERMIAHCRQFSHDRFLREVREAIQRVMGAAAVPAAV